MISIAFKKHDGSEELHEASSVSRYGNELGLSTTEGPKVLDLDLGDAFAMNERGQTIATYRASKPPSEDWSRNTLAGHVID